MPSPSVTYTFANSTTADATQVNQNFTDLINGLTDGTKDLSISALTCAGTATMNGNVTLGNSTSDDVTITGSLAASIPIKTTATYDIGSSTLGLRYIYMGNSTYTLRVAAPTLGASYNYTLPYPSDNQSKSGDYTVLGSDGFIKCDASSAAFTLTLPAAASFSGKHLYIKKTDSTTNAVTIDGNGSETIDGATTLLLTTQYEAVKIISDGSNWQIVERFIKAVISAASNTKTPASSDSYMAMGTTGRVVLPAGVWEISGSVRYSNSGSAAISFIDGQWATTDGSDSSTPPTELTADAGTTRARMTVASSNLTHMEMPTVRLTVSSGTQNVYIVPFATCTAANTRVVTAIVAVKVG